VIIDLAGESGGNAEPSEPGQTVVTNGVKIIAPLNLPSEMATHASQLYAKNVENLLKLLVSDEGQLNLDFDDEIVAGACLTHEGEIKNERAREAAGVTV
jgi:NAD(P) transhydrogenase subunit alpha